jgi:hypothetical protein
MDSSEYLYINFGGWPSCCVEMAGNMVTDKNLHS